MKTIKNYSDYRVTIGQVHDTEQWGANVSLKKSAAYCAKLRELVSRKYPGIRMAEWQDGSVTGPDPAICDLIADWVSDTCEKMLGCQ